MALRSGWARTLSPSWPAPCPRALPRDQPAIHPPPVVHRRAEPWADTSTSIGPLMIAVLAGLADMERDLIHTRSAEGRSRAKARGQHMGRKPKLTAQRQAEARQRAPKGRHSWSLPIATTSAWRRLPGCPPCNHRAFEFGLFQSRMHCLGA